jgi:4-hydroxybenzoate polyprenyltransferase
LKREGKYMKRGLIIGAGIIGVLVGMAFVMPAVAQYQHEGAMSHDEPWLFLLGSLLTLGGCGAAVRGMTKSRA